ncbi:hypothetical protein LIER_20655 [Lithospermum erythrorhizon]|uniref:Uncharacterized protein n=1 Tax=Lithospermum erythrorhizon TaxID=34254 RepID=A0AAV3QSY1_LITER
MYRQSKCWREEKQWCIDNLRGKSFRKQVGRLVLGCAVYVLWIERNSRTLTGICKTIEQLFFSILASVSEEVAAGGRSNAPKLICPYA